MASLPVNPFDAAVYICLFFAVVMGFMSGLLRSLATILGYGAAMGLALALAPALSPILIERFKLPPAQGWLVVAAIFLAGGMALGAMLRYAVSEMVSAQPSIADRVAGAFFGAVRIGLLAVVLVLVFDRIIPPGREPAFLQGSQWRPVLSKAGERGLRTLPPDVVDYIDRLKRERGI